MFNSSEWQVGDNLIPVSNYSCGERYKAPPILLQGDN